MLETNVNLLSYVLDLDFDDVLGVLLGLSVRGLLGAHDLDGYQLVLEQVDIFVILL